MVATKNKLQQIQRTLKKLRDDVEDRAELFAGANAFAVRTPLLKQANVNFVETFILYSIDSFYACMSTLYWVWNLEGD